MRSLNQIMDGLPATDRARVEARADVLIKEEMALRQLRKARDLTQKGMGEILRLDQGAVSRIERRSDMMLSTLRSYVEAMGGSLRLVVQFDDACVEIDGLAQLASSVQREGSKAAALRPRPQTGIIVRAGSSRAKVASKRSPAFQGKLVPANG